MKLRRRRKKGTAPSLSVVCGTHLPGPFVAANLEGVRRIADQIVVGADDRVSESDLGWYGSIADKLVTFPFTGSNQFRAYLRQHATGDWILFLDGDELASAELLSRIPDLVLSRDIGAFALTTRWVYPAPESWLDASPWNPHWNVRLCRNDDMLWFPSTKHTGPFYAGPTQRVDAPLIHLDLLLNSHQDRIAKVAKYDEESIGIVVDGRPINRAFYLPEESEKISLAPMVDVDSRAVVRSLKALRSPSRPLARHSGIPVARATKVDIERTLPWTPFADEDAQAEIEIVEAPVSVLAGTHFLVRLRVTNRGGRVWPSAADRRPAIRCTYRWRADGGVVVADGLRTLLPHPLRPNSSTDMDLLVQAPMNSGEYRLLPDIVAEGDCWFETAEIQEIVVEPSPADLVRELSKDGFVELDDLWELRKRVSLPDSLRWYLSPAAISHQLSHFPLAVTPQVMQALAQPQGDSFWKLVADRGTGVAFLGDVEILGELLREMDERGESSVPIVVLPTGSRNRIRCEEFLAASNHQGCSVATEDATQWLEPISGKTLVMGFGQSPLSIERLAPLGTVRQSLAKEQSLLVCSAGNDLSLSIMKTLLENGIVADWKIQFGASLSAGGFLIPQNS